VGVDKSKYPGWWEVDLQRIVDNSQIAMKLSGNKKLMGVVKQNAYGHGLIPASLAHLSAGASYLGVAQPFEALEIRKTLPKAVVPVLTWIITPETNLTELVENDIEYSIGNFWLLDKTIDLSQKLNRAIEVQIKLDLEFGRDGFKSEDYDRAVEIITNAVKSNQIIVKGVWSHFPLGEENETQTLKVVGEINDFANKLKANGIDYGLRHATNTVGLIMWRDKVGLDMIRSGAITYGAGLDYSQKYIKELGITSASAFKTLLSNIQTVKSGEGIGYSHQYISQKDAKVGIIPIGYADGIPNGAIKLKVYSPKNQKFYPVIGGVCMDQFFIDLDNDDSIQIGDPIEIWGDNVSFYEVAAAQGCLYTTLWTRHGRNVPTYYKNIDVLGDFQKFYDFSGQIVEGN